MTTTSPYLGKRLRAARLAANMTQQELAGGSYSKAYISAIECGKMTPSVQALHVLAGRLGLPASSLLEEGDVDLSALIVTPPLPGSTPVSQQQMRKESARLALDEAENWLRLRQPDRALALLQVPAGPPSDVPALEHPRWYWLAGWALLQLQRYAEAVDLCTAGLSLIEQRQRQMPPAERLAQTELAERLRWALGACYTAQGKAHRAVTLHERGLAAIQEGQVRHPELQMLIVSALVQAYLALDRIDDAGRLYKAIQQLVQTSEEPPAQAQRAWEEGIAYKAQGQAALAQQHLQQALALWAMIEQQQETAQTPTLLEHALQTRQH